MTVKVEHEYIGLLGGIMDQFTMLEGKANSCLLLDCRSKKFELYPLDMTDFLIVLVNTGVSHDLATTEYN